MLVKSFIYILCVDLKVAIKVNSNIKTTAGITPKMHLILERDDM